MRLIKVSAPDGRAADIAKLAFDAGINQVSIQKGESLHASGESEAKDFVDIQTSTPKAKRFIDALLAADFFNRERFSIAVRQPRSIISGDSIRALTEPLVEPAIDIFEELWQYSHLTAGLVGRIFIAGCLLAHGLINQKTLTIIAGLLFLPLLPLLLAIGFGSWTKQPKLAIQGILTFLTAIVLLIVAGALTASLSSPPLKYDEFNSLPVGFLISAAVGIAAGLANSDDAGNRAMIGLAATSQIAIVPVWFGIRAVFGFPATTGENEITSRAAGFFLNVLTIIVASLATYILLGAANGAPAKIRRE